MPIDPGQMRTKLHYQAAVEAADAGGQPVPTWADSFAFFARVRPARGDERVRAGGVGSDVGYEIMCRFDPRIATTGRLRIDGTERVLEISSVVDWELRGSELTITAHERVPRVE